MSVSKLTVFVFLAVMTYHQNVAPILDKHCVECHSAGKSLDLSRFPFKWAAGNDQLQIVNLILAKTGGTKPKMPPGNRPKLTANQLNVIEQWRNDGLNP